MLQNLWSCSPSSLTGTDHTELLHAANNLSTAFLNKREMMQVSLFPRTFVKILHSGAISPAFGWPLSCKVDFDTPAH